MVKKTHDGTGTDGLVRHDAAAVFLQQHLHEPDGYWSNFLTNNRRPDRKPAYRIPFEKHGGAVVYRVTDLAAFLKSEKQRRLTGVAVTGRAAELLSAYGIGSTTGGPYGRTLNYDLHVQDDHESGAHAQLIINDPLLVFYLPLAKVEELAEKFSAAAKQLKGTKRHG